MLDQHTAHCNGCIVVNTASFRQTVHMSNGKHCVAGEDAKFEDVAASVAAALKNDPASN